MSDDRFQMILDLQKKDPDDPFLAYAAALEVRKKGDSEDAINRLQTLKEKDPSYLGTYYQLGKLLEEKGESDEAILIYKAGMTVAKEKNDSKTLGELTEALFILTDDDEEW